MLRTDWYRSSVTLAAATCLLLAAPLVGQEPAPLETFVYTGLPNAWSAFLSPDDSKIAFTDWEVTREEGLELEYNWEVFVMNADGTEIRNLTRSPSRDSDSSWHPDGEHLSFVSDRGGETDIYMMRLDGTGLTRLTVGPDREGEHDWSPDGGRLAFTRERDGNWEIYVMDADGSNVVNLSNNPATDRWPDWSPDGRKIAFGSRRDGDEEIYIMNADGSGQTRLTHSPGRDLSPDISPDGRRIAFDSGRDRVGPDDLNDVADQLYVMDLDGSNERRLTLTPTGYDVEPDWSSDGSRIVFNSLRDGLRSIYSMAADGSELTRLTYGWHSEFYDTVRSEGVEVALDRLARSKQNDPERRYHGGGELHALGYELLEAGRAQEAARLWSAFMEDIPHFQLDLRVAHRAAGLDAPPFPDEVMASIRHQSAAVGMATLRSLNAAYPSWQILEERDYESLAGELQDEGRETLGVELLRIGVERFPESVALWNGLGDTLLAVRDKEGAVEAYAVVARIDPDGADAADRLARARAD